MKKLRPWLVLLLLVTPAFSLMLRSGIFTMHDPHLFRIYEFNRCIQDRVFPCRWAPDSGKGYGEPLFNFYAQFPYWITASFHLTGFSLIDSAKAAFILSLMASAGAMYLFARRFWGSWGGLVSAVFYIYAPYRAVDVWVRGALPEALAFIFYPLILLFLDLYLQTRKTVYCLLFSFALALLITTHNLSFLMFIPFLFVYWLFRSWQGREIKNLIGLMPAGIFALALSAYYLLPVMFESRLITLADTTTGYYDYHIHFTRLYELFISRYWGYGASLWAQKFLSVSIGQLHWIIPLLLLFYVVIKKKLFSPITINYLLFTVLGVVALFLTHGKSSFIWNFLPVFKYIQFPWRFLSVAVFFLSLASGFAAQFITKKYLNILVISVILINFSFFRPDIWRNITDSQEYSGALWDEGRSSSLTDFWPKTAEVPVTFSSGRVSTVYGEATVTDFQIKSNSASLSVSATAPSRITLPIVYFPGWQLLIDNRTQLLTSLADSGLITFSLSPGVHEIKLLFTDTWPRYLGNLTSLSALILSPLWLIKKKLG
jgi:hypothetical protein